MSNGSYADFRDALRAFESGWDRERYDTGTIQDWQLDQWAGGTVGSIFPEYTSWSQLSDTEWDSMSYRSMNSLGFVGYQFGEALLIDLGYYDDDFFYGNGAASNTWDGIWTGKNGVNSLEAFMTKDAQEIAIREAFGFNLKIIEEGLANGGQSLSDFIGTTGSYIQNGETVEVELTLTGIMAAAHLRGAYGTLALLQGGSASTDEYGTSILQYIDQFGGYDAPSVAEAIAFFESRTTGDEGLGGGNPTDGESPNGGAGGNGSAEVEASTADVVITWSWGQDQVVSNFDPANGTVFVDWIGADFLDVEETASGVVFTVASNNQTTTLAGISLADLSPANFAILDSTAAEEILGLIGGEDSGGDDTGDEHDHGEGQMVMIDLDSGSRTVPTFNPATDMIHIGGGITGERFEIFEESGDALGLTVRVVVTEPNGTVLSTTIIQGIGLDDLTLSNFSIAEQSTLNEVTSALGLVISDPDSGGGYALSYDNDGSNPPVTTGSTASGGLNYRADVNADDIVGFDAGVDALDFGDTSVHGMIVTKSLAGEVVIDSPWSAEAQIVHGIGFDELSIDSFGVVGNEHFRQDIGGVLSWELGVGPREADTVYLRSHEYGQAEVIENFDPDTMNISFLYFGTRERLSVEDTDQGMVISSLPTGQSATFSGVELADLIPGRVEFHHDQVMEDNLEVAFGFDQDDVTLVDRTVLLTPATPPGQTTDGVQTRQGDLMPGGDNGGDGKPDDETDGNDTAPPSDQADVTTIGYDWGAIETLSGFLAAEDLIDFAWMTPGNISIREEAEDLIIEVVGNGGHAYIFEGVQAEDLSGANLAAAANNSVLGISGGVVDQLVQLGFEDTAF